MNKKNNIRILSRKRDLSVIQARMVGIVIKKSVKGGGLRLMF